MFHPFGCNRKPLNEQHVFLVDLAALWAPLFIVSNLIRVGVILRLLNTRNSLTVYRALLSAPF